jgi:hypothetical protein
MIFWCGCLPYSHAELFLSLLSISFRSASSSCLKPFTRHSSPFLPDDRFFVLRFAADIMVDSVRRRVEKQEKKSLSMGFALGFWTRISLNGIANVSLSQIMSARRSKSSSMVFKLFQHFGLQHFFVGHAHINQVLLDGSDGTVLNFFLLFPRSKSK